MWNPQAGLVDDLVAEEQQIQIDRARSEPGPFARAPEVALDRQEALEELARSEVGLDSRRGVEEARLVEKANRFRLHECRDRRNLDRGVSTKSLKGSVQVGLAVTEVRSEPDPGGRHARQARCLN